MNDALPRFLSPPQVARILGVKVDKVRGWIVRGELDALNVSDALQPRYRVSPEAFEAFQKGRAVVQPSPPPRKRCRRPEHITEFY